MEQEPVQELELTEESIIAEVHAREKEEKRRQEQLARERLAREVEEKRKRE